MENTNSAKATLPRYCMSATKIYEYIQAKKYSPAKQLLSKELETNPQSSVFHALEGLLAYKLNNRRLALEIAQSVLKLPNLNATVVNSLLGPILLAYSEPVLLSSGFEVVSRKQPQDKEAVQMWIECALILGDAKMLCKALMANNKQQQSRASNFQTCFALYLVWSLAKPADLEFKVYPQLAMRMLEPFLPATNQDEFDVQALVFSMQNKLADLVYETPKYQSLYLQQPLIDSLAKNEKWNELWEYSLSSLKRIDSFNCWQALNKAALATGRASEAREFASNYSSNNSLLALIELESSKLEPLKAYWERFQSKGCAYEYLKEYLHVEEFVGYLHKQEPASFAAQVNIVKLKYLVDSSVDVPTLVALYQSHLDELPSEKTDYFVGSDLLLIAAISLVEAGKTLEAVVLLEYGLENDPSSFYIQLWLIKLYRHLGISSKVAAFYKRLSIKNMQHETLGYLVATRGASMGMDPQLYKDILKTYVQSDNMYSVTANALKDQVYCQIPSMLQLQQKMNCSLSRAMTHLEVVRSSRINRGECDLSEVINVPRQMIDNRDTSTFFDPHGKHSEPEVGKTWVQGQLAREQLFLDIIRGAESYTEVDTSAFTAIEKWSVQCLQERKIVEPVPIENDRFTWEFIHTGYTILETCKLLGDICARTKMPRPNFGTVKDRLSTLLESPHQHDVEPIKLWASGLNIDASSTLESITTTRAKAVSDLAKLIK